MSKSYSFHSFSERAWRDFHERGNARITGFPNSRRSKVNKIQMGDHLLCYLTAPHSCWIGALEVISSPIYLSDEPLLEKDRIWHDVEFRNRVEVKVLISLSPKTGVPVKSLKDHLSIFKGAKPDSWKGHLRDNPRKWSEADGIIIMAALEGRYNAVIREYLAQDLISLKLEEGDENIIKGFEGEKKLIYVNHYERDVVLRAEAIRMPSRKLCTGGQETGW